MLVAYMTDYETTVYTFQGEIAFWVVGNALENVCDVAQAEIGSPEGAEILNAYRAIDGQVGESDEEGYCT
jgi:hypothetical protein